MTKNKLQAILPLTSNQQSFLLHSLQNQEADSGVILVQMDLIGKLNRDFFKQAWEKTIERHSALRTSVHWKKIEKPVQVIHESASLPFHFLDWSDSSDEDFEKKITTLKNKNNQLELSKAPISNFFLIKKSDTSHKLFWFCHHILLDGWSSSIIVKDFMAYYDALHQGIDAALETLPTQKEYFKWLLSQNENDAQNFWKEHLKNLESPNLFEQNTSTSSEINFNKQILTLSEEDTNALINFSKENRTTLNNVFLGLWGILLHSFFDKKHITFGTTVSGRTAPLENFHLTAGLFMNVIPVLLEITPEIEFKDWLKKNQSHQAKTISYQQNTLNQIQSWIDFKHTAFFDSLILFENFPWSDLQGGDLEIKNYKSGISTTYPLTLTVVPRDAYQFHFQYNSKIISKEFILWISKQLEKLISKIIAAPAASLFELKAIIDEAPQLISTQPTLNTLHTPSKDYEAPQNKIELQLTKMWEMLLGFSPISATDNFFQIGGKSLHAVRLLGQIEQQMGHNLPPVTLVQNPTIRELGAILSGEKTIPDWSYLVPIKTAGSQPPLFCLHAGGGHTFFYNDLAQYLHQDQPVYSVQPFISNTENKLHASMEEMAADYLKDIKAAQPEGPYIFLVYCFSIALGIEMIRQLQEEGITDAHLINIDTALPPEVAPLPNQMSRLKDYWQSEGGKKIWSLVKRKVKNLPRRLNNKITKKDIQSTSQTPQEKTLQEMVSNLQKIHIAYHWKTEWNPIDAKVTYIQSSESFDVRGNREVERQNSFFSNKVKAIIIDGKHRTLFEEPEIQNLAKAIQNSLDNFSTPTKSTSK